MWPFFYEHNPLLTQARTDLRPGASIRTASKHQSQATSRHRGDENHNQAIHVDSFGIRPGTRWFPREVDYRKHDRIHSNRDINAVVRIGAKPDWLSSGRAPNTTRSEHRWTPGPRLFSGPHPDVGLPERKSDPDLKHQSIIRPPDPIAVKVPKISVDDGHQVRITAAGSAARSRMRSGRGSSPGPINDAGWGGRHWRRRRRRRGGPARSP